jgi:hypothetical protein
MINYIILLNFIQPFIVFIFKYIFTHMCIEIERERENNKNYALRVFFCFILLKNNKKLVQKL